MQKYIVFLEGEKRATGKLSGEPLFFRRLWQQVPNASTKFCECCGNTQMSFRLFTELSKDQYDAVYLNYDTVNTYISSECSSIFKTIKDYCQTLDIPCYILRAPSFEALLLQSEVVADLIACVSLSNSLKNRGLLYEARDFYLKCLDAGNYAALCTYKTTDVDFNRVWLADVNAEKRVYGLLSQLTSKFSKLWHCSKGEIGRCWLDSCQSIKAVDYACKKQTSAAFATCLCDYEKINALLTSLLVKSIKELYMPFNDAAYSLSEKDAAVLDPELPTNVFN